VTAKNSILQVWDLDNFKTQPDLVFTDPHNFDSFSSLDIDSTGKMLLGSTNGLLFLWDFRPEALIAQACDLAGRNLTSVEWTTYLPDMPYHLSCPQWLAEK
jgi:hypothetical protein